MIRLLKTIFSSTSPSSPWMRVGDLGSLVMKYSVSSLEVDICTSPEVLGKLMFLI